MLGNMNGTLYDSGSKRESSGESQRTPGRLSSRRESTAWMRTPSDQGNDDQDDDIDWSKYILTPVPKTPAPEALAKYVSEMPETPGGDDEEDSCMSPATEALITKTCPPPKMVKARDMGPGLFERQSQDDQVVKRLLAAKRKSLQFAPRIASPLSKTWK